MMYSRRPLPIRLSRLLVFCCLATFWCFGAPGVRAAVVDTTKIGHDLEVRRAAEHQALYDKGNSTLEAHKAIDDKYLELARAAEPLRTGALKDLAREAKVEKIAQGAGGTNPAEGRGTFGDVDTDSFSGADFDRIIKAAEAKGYTITGKGDYRTIKELNTTVHRASSPYTSPRGSSAREAEIARGYGKETALGMGNSDPNVSAMDNCKKALHTLDEPPGSMSNESLQELGKMTGRNLKGITAGDKYARLAAQAEGLKKGYTPESAGIVRPNATAEQRAQDIGDFQGRCREANVESVRQTMAKAQSTDATLKSRCDQAQQQYEAARRSGDADLLRKSRVELETAKGDLIDYRAVQGAARESLVRNQPDGAKFLEEVGGVKLEKVTLSTGRQIYRDPWTGKWYTPSQLSEAAIAGAREPLMEAARSPTAEAPTSPVMNGAGKAVMAYMIFEGALEGAHQAVDEAAPDESAVTTWAKATAYGTFNATGIPGAWKMGMEAGNASMDRYNRELAEGKDPSWVWAKTRGAGTSAGAFVKAMTWDPLALGWTAVKEGTGLVGDLYTQVVTRESNLLQQAATLDQAVASARKLAQQLQDLTTYIDQLGAALTEGDAQLRNVTEMIPALQQQQQDDAAVLTQMMDQVEAIRQVARQGPPVKDRQTQLSAEFAAIQREADGQAQAIEVTLQGLRDKKLAIDDAHNVYQAIVPRFQDNQSRYEQAQRRVTELNDMAQAGALRQSIEASRTQAVRNLSTVQTASSDLRKAVRGFADLSARMTTASATFDDLKGRLTTGIEAFYARTKADSEQENQLVILRRIVNRCEGRSQQAARFAAASNAYNYDTQSLTSLGHLELPETGDLSDLQQIGSAAAAALGAVSGAASSAGQAVEQARQQVFRFKSVLDNFREDCRLVVSPASSKLAPGGAIDLMATVAAPPPQWRVEWNLGDGSWVPSTSSDAQSARKRAGFAKAGTYNIGARLIDARTQRIVASAGATAVVEDPKATTPEVVVKPPPPESGKRPADQTKPPETDPVEAWRQEQLRTIGLAMKTDLEANKQLVDALVQSLNGGGSADCPQCGRKATFRKYDLPGPTPGVAWRCAGCGRGTLSPWEFRRSDNKTYYQYQKERMAYYAQKIGEVDEEAKRRRKP